MRTTHNPETFQRGSNRSKSEEPLKPSKGLHRGRYAEQRSRHYNRSKREGINPKTLSRLR